ncbi:hypothetical protein BD770DRAFT_442830 [Pilaira anomala]|nr:hypothetical protein BD770DRAFT_442830 [Pilaira anomala]
MTAAKKNLKTKEVVPDNAPSTRRRTRDATKEPATQPQQQKEQEQEQQQQQEAEKSNKNDIKTVIDDLNVSEVEEQPVKRKRGRPSNKEAGKPSKVQKVIDPSIPKRGRGRPKKVIA